MIETDIVLYSATGRQHTARILNSTPLNIGTDYTKVAIDVVINPDRNKHKVIKMIKRRACVYSDYEGERTLSQQYIYLWEKLKSIGIPVAPTVAIINDLDVAVTNLTADGSGIYGKHQARKFRGALPTDNILKTIDLDTIKGRALEFANIATRNNIELPHDHAFDLVVHPNGSWEVMALDIEETHIGIRDEVSNTDTVERFIEHLENIRQEKWEES